MKYYAGSKSPGSKRVTRPFFTKSSADLRADHCFFSAKATPQTVQAKHTVNEANDVFEQQADRIADQIVAGGAAAEISSPVTHTSLQRKCAGCEDEEKLQRKSRDAATAANTATGVGSAKRISANVPERVTPHMFRHSKAMHLLQAGVSLIYIRDFLGHEDIKTTEIYAKCDSEMKRQAIENAYPDLVDNNLPDWSKDAALLDWRSSLR